MARRNKRSRKKVIHKRNCTVIIVPKRRSYRRHW